MLIDGNNDGVITQTDDTIEENSPGKLIQVSKTEEIEQRVPMIFELPREGFESSNATILFGFPSHLVLFTEETGGTQLVNGQLYTKDQLGQLDECGVMTLYVGATFASFRSGVDIISVTADPDGEGPEEGMTDQVVVTAFDFKYVRVYDENKVPNRSTRAVGVPETEMLYEDNPRSDYDLETTPGIMLGGMGAQMNYANIATEIEFTPNDMI